MFRMKFLENIEYLSFFSFEIGSFPINRHSHQSNRNTANSHVLTANYFYLFTI